MSVDVYDSDRERLKQIRHLAEVLYSETADVVLLNRIKRQVYQSLIDEMQELLDACVTDRSEV